jgi:fumarate hydratase class II
LRTGIEPNYKRITELVDNSLMLVTALNTKIGLQISRNCSNSKWNNFKRGSGSFRICNPEDFDAWVKPEDMVGSLK